MRNIRLHSNQLIDLVLSLDNGIFVSDADLFRLMCEAEESMVSIHFYEEILQFVILRPKKIIVLWAIPQNKIDEYDFCPDQRILTHRLIGKPALGLSPPKNMLKICNTTGFVNSRSELN